MYCLSFLVISGNEEFYREVNTVLSDMKFISTYASNIGEGMEKALSGSFDILIFDLTTENCDCVKQLNEIIQARTLSYIVAFADKRKSKIATEAVESGFCTYRNFPLDIKEFRHLATKISEIHNLKKDVEKKEKILLHFEVINEIARKSLNNLEEDTFLWELAKLIQEKFDIYNVNIFLTDENAEYIVLKAFAGGFGDDLVVGYSLGMGEGICGWVTENGKSLIFGDVKNEPRRIQGFGFEDVINSELAVPIIYDNKVQGVLHAESIERDAFTSDDLMALETVADQISAALENLRLTRELIESNKLSGTINDSLPVSLLILDKDFKIRYVNLTFCETNSLKREEVLGRQFIEFLSDEFSEKFDLSDELQKVIDSKIPIRHSNVRHSSPYHQDKVLNVTFTYVETERNPRIMVLIQDVTEFTKKTYQLLLLREISLAMQGVMDRDKLLHLILTSVTAGFAIGFNRAFLFLVDDNKKKLKCILGVGPSSYEEAYRTWDELSRKQLNFQDYLEYVHRGEISKSSLHDLVENITFDIENTKNILTETVKTGKYFHVLNAWEDTRVNDEMKVFLATKEFITIPLITRSEVIGVLMADNAYSGRNISVDSIELLTMLGGSAAIAIENAKILVVLEEKIRELQNAYAELKKTHEMLINKEKLAAIGEVSARLAHEIRNPLSTIGGFAKSIPKKYEDRELTIRNAGIIVEEVKRLEQILTNVLDYSKPSIPVKSPTEIKKLIVEIIGMFEETLNSKGVDVVTNFSEDGNVAEFDSAQIRQVLINVIQNALFAMPEGGILEIESNFGDEELCIRINDTGKGIPAENLESVFEPFFTTYDRGTGLGLAISQIIIQNHNGNIKIESEEYKGTSVSIFLPIK